MKITDLKTNKAYSDKFDGYRWLAFCGEDMAAAKNKADGRFRKLAVTVLAAAAALMMLGFFTSGSGKDPAEQFARGEYGEEEHEIMINARASYGEEVLDKEFELIVRPRKLNRKEADILFDACEEFISSRIIISDEVSSDLELPELSPDGLVEISWHSEDPARLSDEGKLDLLELPEHCEVRLNAVMTAGEYVREHTYSLKVSAGSAVPSMERSLDNLAEELSASDGGTFLELPDEREGMQLFWELPGREAPWELIPLGLFVLLALYFGRYDAEERRLKKIAADFEAEIPSMTLQLTLLLNAGSVISAAFDELIEKNVAGGHPLYTALAAVKEKADGENLPFVSELYTFANSTGCRDFIRLSSLILDHASRGNELADKLEKERAQLWASRLSTAKARTKEAETRLCLPLMLLLIVLVVISAAPALMTM